MSGEALARCSICGEEHPVATMVTAHRDPEELPDELPDEVSEPGDWGLEDAEAMQAEHPRSFFIPPAERRAALRRGELVKLGFAYGPHADRDGEGHVERIWVEVLEQAGDGRARGRLRNRPFRLSVLEIGDIVSFRPGHVLSIDYGDDELGYAQDEWVVVDRAVVGDDRAPDVVVRAPGPDATGGQAWWMLSREYPAGPESETAGVLTDRFPGLAEPLRAGDGLWVLAGGEGADARWTRVSDGERAEWRSLFDWLEQAADALR